MTTPYQLGRRIRRLRSELGLSQKEVSEPVLTSAYLSLIESGQRMPSDEILRHLAERLGATTEELLSGVPAGFEAQLELELQETRSLLREGNPDAAEDRATHVLREARKREFSRLESRALTLLALIEEDRGDIELAITRFDEALDAWSAHPPHLKYEAVAGRGRCLYFAGRSREAAYDLESYLLQLRQVGMRDPTAEARVHSTLIHVYQSLGLKEKQFDAARAADALSADLKEPEQLACLKVNVAAALIEQGDFADAIAAIRDAEVIFSTLGWPVSVARSQVDRAIAESARGELERARDLLLQALGVLDGVSYESAERAYVLNELGRTERLMGDVEDALDHLRAARSLIPEKDVAEQARNLREIGLCLALTNPRKAERELRGALELYREADSPNEVSATLLQIGRLQQSQGKTKQALKTLEDAVQATVGEVR